MRKDIRIRNLLILRLFRKGIPRKQIPGMLILKHTITYETVKKALNAAGIFDWHYERRKKLRP